MKRCPFCPISASENDVEPAPEIRNEPQPPLNVFNIPSAQNRTQYDWIRGKVLTAPDSKGVDVRGFGQFRHCRGFPQNRFAPNVQAGRPVGTAGHQSITSIFSVC